MNIVGRYRLIKDRRSQEDYLHRYYLFIKDRKQFPFNFVLHKIVRSDDPIMHDHPWAYTTVILAGGYWEHTCEWNNDRTSYKELRTWRGPGSIIHRKANEFHWLELENEQPATTLFFMGKQERQWGFLTGNPQNSEPLVWVDEPTFFEDPKWIEYHFNNIQPSVATLKKAA